MPIPRINKQNIINKNLNNLNSLDNFVVALTGHRPTRLGGYYSHIIKRLDLFACDVIKELNPSKLITGMALGWDQAGAKAAIKLGIPFIAAIPFIGQESQWPVKSQQLYRHILSLADEVVIVSQGSFSPEKMQIRNEWMVDHSDYILSLWNGKDLGGTYKCLKYAEIKKKTVIDVWDKWEKTHAK